MKKKNYIDIFNLQNKVELGFHTGYMWANDPKHLLFTLSRYKFVSKMFDGFEKVLEVGAGDGFQSEIVESAVKKLILSDVEKKNQSEFLQRTKSKNKKKYLLLDFTKEKLNHLFDGIYLIDVFEHISKKKQNKFLSNLCKSLKKKGVVLIGIPSKESQKYAAKINKKEHVNCQNKSELKKTMQRYFDNVFMFSMNDEVLHTGYDQMSHYVFALCTGKKI